MYTLYINSIGYRNQVEWSERLTSTSKAGAHQKARRWLKRNIADDYKIDKHIITEGKHEVWQLI